MIKLINCANCGADLSAITHKKKWKYTIYEVRMVVCPKCGKSVKVYYKDGKQHHTISKKAYLSR